MYNGKCRVSCCEGCKVGKCKSPGSCDRNYCLDGWYNHPSTGSCWKCLDNCQKCNKTNKYTHKEDSNKKVLENRLPQIRY